MSRSEARREKRLRAAQMQRTLAANAAESPLGPAFGLGAAAALLSALAICLLVFATFARHTQILPSRGLFLSAARIVSVKAPVAGVIVATHVRRGDQVDAGAPLFTIARHTGMRTIDAAAQRVTVRAPVAGCVADLSLIRGGHVLPDQQTVMTLQRPRTIAPTNPSGDAMPASSAAASTVAPSMPAARVVAYVGAAAMGAIATDRGVRVWFDAYPPELYGSFQARVLNISHTAIDIRHAPLRLPETGSYYQITLALTDPVTGPARELLALRDGMSVTVDFIGEQRTVLEWLLAPLQRIRQRLLHAVNA
ncbi:MAG: HlyD family efflux transporter periplasmic adaptor subunit [Janthinobacterium lividum]